MVTKLRDDDGWLLRPEGSSTSFAEVGNNVDG